MKKIYIILLAALCFTACADWLDVRPQSEVDQNDLFANEEGFQNALNGVYLELGKDDLYGDNLSLSITEVLAQNYVMSSGDKLFEILNYNYSTDIGENKISSIWGTAYNVIANCNNIIEHLNTSSPSLFSLNNYKRMQGEALALRAFLHFDLLRLFNAPYASQPDAMGIPYVTEVKTTTTAQQTTNQSLADVLKDLEIAYNLLKEADEITGDESANSYRENRMNYYAVAALRARVSLYKGDYANALTFANEVIESERFQWILPGGIVNKNDYVFYSEHIFSLYNLKIGETARKYFSSESFDKMVCAGRIGSLYEGDDIRFKYWFKLESSAGSNKRFMTKYNRLLDEGESKNYQPPTIPMIKLSEMYLIAAEAMAQTNLPAAIKLLNEMKSKRVTSEIDENSDVLTFMVALDKEYQREFVGEGQVFYHYKRMNYTNIAAAGAGSIEMNDEKYTLPFPEDEVTFGGREN